MFKHEQELAFINRYMKAKYALDGEGPDEFNCYSFLRLTQSELFNVDLPPLKLENDTIAEYIHKLALTHDKVPHITVQRPMHGCIVEMSHSTTPHHVGTWLNVDGGGVLHCLIDQGVCFDPMVNLKAAGWRRFIYAVPEKRQS